MTEPRDRRELILSTAAEMFARKGIRSTTVREIADAVGVLSGSLYHYFSSKDEIVKEILMGFLDAIRARYDEVQAHGADAAETLREVVLVSLQVAGSGRTPPRSTRMSCATCVSRPRTRRSGPRPPTCSGSGSV
jgi:AcrR family transcriptional regulator